MTPSPAVQLMWAEALQAYAEERFDLAQGLAEQVLAQYPQHDSAADMLALQYQQAGRLDAALATLRQAQLFTPTDSRRQQLISILGELIMQHASAGTSLALLSDFAGLLELRATAELEALFEFLLEQYRHDPDLAVGIAVLLQKYPLPQLQQRWGEPAPRILLVLPPRALTVAQIERFQRSLQQNLGHQPIHIARRGDADNNMAGTMPTYQAMSALCYTSVAFIEGPGEGSDSSALSNIHPRVYRFDQSDPGFEIRLMPVDRDPDTRDYPYVHSHVFNRVTSRLHNHYYFFPYGYLYRYLGVGPINEFGHRIAHPLASYRQRPPEHKLIACFGGSSCFSMYCLHDEMFPALLEKRLNDWATRQSNGLRFTVLNFGQHGNVVLNHLLTYLLFVQDLRPDAILAHDGFNDLAYGQMADPELLGEHRITYQENLEEWGALLNGRNGDLPQDWVLDGVRQIQNYPDAVIDAYLTRQAQFAGISRAAGAHFIWGLQPFLLSKRQRSAAEKGFEKQAFETRNRFIESYRNMNHLYENTIERAHEAGSTRFINLHEAFASLPADTSHLFDIVHLSPAGDAAVADMYLPHLIELFAGDTA